MKLMFIIYSLTLFFISNGLGKLVTSKKSKMYPFRSLVGFCIFILVLQLGYYPIQFLQLSISYVYVWTLIVSVISMIVSIKNFSKSDYKVFRSWQFYFLIILVFLVIKILPMTEAGDDWFYMPLIMDNVDAARINSLDPRTGWGLDIGSVWSYQGYYLLATCLYKIQTLFDSSVNAIFVSFRSTFTLLMIIYSAVVLSEVTNMMSQKNKYISTMTQILSILLIGFLEWSHIYWGSFATFTTFFPLLILQLNYCAKEPSKKMAIYIAITNGAILSLFSSALFLTAFLIYSFFAYSVTTKKSDIVDYLIMLIPSFIFLFMFIEIPLLVVFIAPIFFFIRNVVARPLNKLLNDYGKNLVAVIPVLIIVVTPLLGMKYTWSLYRLSYTFLAFNLIVAFAVIFEVIFKKFKIEPLLFAFSIFVITFFNPLVCSCISRFFTSDQVYYRLFYITKNPIMILFIFTFIYNRYCTGKLLLIGYKSLLTLLVMYYSFVLFRSVNFNISISNDYDYLLREDINELEVGKFLLENEDYRGKLVWSDYIQPRMFNNDLKARVSRYPESDQGVDILDRFLHSEKELSSSDYIESKNAIHRAGVELLITKNNESVKNRVKLISDIIFENNSYIVYKVR